MKNIFIFSMLFLTGLSAMAAPAQLHKASGTNEMIIEADGGFAYEAPTAVYRNNVRVSDPQMEMICELLTIYFQTNNNTVNLIVAETNVVIIEQDRWAISDKAVFTATNNIVELTGNVLLEAPQGYLMGESVWYDRKINKIFVPGKVKMGGPVLTGTNSPFSALPGAKPPTPTNTVVAPRQEPK